MEDITYEDFKRISEDTRLAYARWFLFKAEALKKNPNLKPFSYSPLASIWYFQMGKIGYNPDNLEEYRDKIDMMADLEETWYWLWTKEAKQRAKESSNSNPSLLNLELDLAHAFREYFNISKTYLWRKDFDKLH